MDKITNVTSTLKQTLTPQVVERVTLKPQIVTWSIPPPHPAVALPTPDELHLMKQTAKAQAATAYNEELRSGAEDITGEGRQIGQRAVGLWKVVKGFTQRTVVEVSAGTTRVLRDHAVNQDLNDFVRDFPDIANSGAVHVSAHECVTSHLNLWESCTVHLTSTHICIVGAAFIDALPLTMVASVIPSVSLPTVDGAPLLVEIPDPRVVANGLQVYTTTKKCYLFAKFTANLRHKIADQTVKELSPLMQFYSALDRAWRTEQRVPVAGVEYARIREGGSPAASQGPLDQ